MLLLMFVFFCGCLFLSVIFVLTKDFQRRWCFCLFSKRVSPVMCLFGLIEMII